MNKTIVIIDHEKRLSASVSEHLQNYGYRVVVADDRAMVSEIEPDIVLIHENAFCRDLRREVHRIPVILIVSDPEQANAVSAFHLNVNDCVTHDIKVSALVQRIRRCLTTLAPEKRKVPLGRGLYLPHDFQIICQNEERIDLLPKENELLLLFCSKQGEICTKEELVQDIWGGKVCTRPFSDDHWYPNLNDLVCRLKKKLKKVDSVHIENIKKIGYRLCVLEKN